MKNKLTILFCSLGLLACQTSGASVPLVHVYLNGYGGTNWVGDLDALASVVLGLDRNLYIYGQGRFAGTNENWQDNTMMGSLGVGYRQMYFDHLAKKTRILGGYLLVDYNKTISNHNLFDLNPGIESLGEKWDFRLNGYIPLGAKNWQSTYWASDLSDYTYYQPTGHEVYDAQYVYDEEAGYGGDAEVGYKVFSIKHMPLKAFLDGYWFSMQSQDDIFGLGARVTFQVTHYLTFEAKYTYDNYQHNVILGGIRIYLNGFAQGLKNTNVDDDNLQDRLFDQIERGVATSQLGNSMPVVGGPQSQANNNNDPDIITPVVKDDNVWYFNGSDTGDSVTDDDNNGNGTYENPYAESDFTQDTVNYINQYTQDNSYDHASLYLSSGTYDNLAYNNSSGIIILGQDDSIYGTDSDFKTPATGNGRPLLIGGLELEGGNTVDSIQLQNLANGSVATGITIPSGVDNITLNNIMVGVSDSNNGSYKQGINITGANNVTINNSQIFSYYVSSSSNTNVTAINIVDSTAININENNTVTVYTKAGGTTNSQGDISAEAYGIAINNSSVNIGSNNAISATALGGSANVQGDDIQLSAEASADAVTLKNSSTLNISDKNTFISTASGGNIQATGTLTGTMQPNANGYAYGINASYSSVYIGNNNTITSSATGGTITSSKSSLCLDEANSSAKSIYVNNGQITIGNNNDITAHSIGGKITATATELLLSATSSASSIDVRESSTLNIFGGGNILNSTSSIQTSGKSETAEAFGILAVGTSKVIFDFAKIGSNKNVFNINGSSYSYGIYVETLSHLMKKTSSGDVEITDANELLQYNTFNDYGTTVGEKIWAPEIRLGW